MVQVIDLNNLVNVNLNDTNYRFFANLEKDNNLGAEIVLNNEKAYILPPPRFMKTIPVMKTEPYPDYTDSNGAVSHLDVSGYNDNQKQNILKILYLGVYNDSNVNLDGNNPPLPLPVFGSGPNPAGGVANSHLNTNANAIKNNSPMSYNVDAKLIVNDTVTQDISKLVENLRSDDDNKSQNQNQSNPQTPIDYILDTNSGKTYRWEKGQLVDSSSKPVNYPIPQGLDASNNCYTLGTNDGEKCKTMVQCLLDNDSTALKRCLDLFNDRDLFDVAANEVKNLDPVIALRLMKKFGIKKKGTRGGDGATVYLAQNISEWLTDIEDDSVRRKLGLTKEFVDAVKSNTGLKRFLEGVVETINNNKHILNPGMDSASHRTMVQKYNAIHNPDTYGRFLKPYVPQSTRGTGSSSLLDIQTTTMDTSNNQSALSYSLPMVSATSISQFRPITAYGMIGGGTDDDRYVMELVNGLDEEQSGGDCGSHDEEDSYYGGKIDETLNLIKSIQSGGNNESVRNIAKRAHNNTTEILGKVNTMYGGAETEQEGSQYDYVECADSLYRTVGDIRNMVRNYATKETTHSQFMETLESNGKQEEMNRHIQSAVNSLYKLASGNKREEQEQSGGFAIFGSPTVGTANNQKTTFTTTRERSMVSNAEVFKKLFRELFEELDKAGKQLKEEDKQNIYKTIDHLRQIEYSLAAVNNLQNKYIQTVLPRIKDDDQNISMESMKKHQEVKQEIHNIMDKLEERTQRFQQLGGKISERLIGNVYKDLARSARGETSA
jgi:hypothetical protein